MTTDKHKIKMRAKKIRRQYRYDNREPVYVPANLSRNHPDWGMSVKGHLFEKDLRASEKSS